MQTWIANSLQAIQILTWLWQLLICHAPQLDPDWLAHWSAVLGGQHFAGEYWHNDFGDRLEYWWADVIDTLLDLILPFRADH